MFKAGSPFIQVKSYWEPHNTTQRRVELFAEVGIDDLSPSVFLALPPYTSHPQSPLRYHWGAPVRSHWKTSGLDQSHNFSDEDDEIRRSAVTSLNVLEVSKTLGWCPFLSHAFL